ncbi:MAG: DUF1353 domain-containing protein [bacterium]
MKSWQKYRKAIIGTLGAFGIWLAAIMSFQPDVPPANLPLWNSGINEWTLTNNCKTSVTVSGVTYTVTIKEGFKTDGASIPEVLAAPLGLTRDSPAIIRGALIHDAIYASELLDRQTADSILYAACLNDGMAPEKALAVWKAVREWGFVAWDRHTDESVSTARTKVEVHTTSRTRYSSSRYR